MTPLVSVIIPNYNHATFLRQRIDSILNQTWTDFELIILDDYSTDNSRDIIEFYRNHPKVKHIIYNENNSGSPFKQWQKGLELAVAPYIWIAESDDYSDKSFLNCLMQPFLTEPDLVLSYCQSMVVDENGTLNGLSIWADEIDRRKWKHDYIEKTAVELDNYLSFRNTIVNASAVVFKKPLNGDILQESTEMKMLGDWLFWRKLLSQEGKIAFFSSPLNFFRLHPQTTRVATTKEKEITRMKEYHRLIVPQFLSILDNRYDWMVREWYANRRVLKGTLFYFIPDLPFTLKIRFIIIIVSKIRKKILGVQFSS
ncbi:MAG TPA: glycosyltransferase [Segetibacter sp.]|jgi:glycosyltransferase involved in cell wall biosynthesis